MAIQFHCPSCQNAIEVDDQWSGQQVSCPYCRTTVAAPIASTIVPTASPSATTSEAASRPGPASIADRGNRAAVWAYWLSYLWLLVMIPLIGLTTREIPAVIGPQGTPADLRRWVEEKAAAGEVPQWLAAVMVLGLLSLLLWLAGLGCAVVGWRARRQRDLVYAALGLLALWPGAMVLSLLSS